MVADGAGGSSGGEVAAELLVSIAKAELTKTNLLAPHSCAAALARADEAILQDARAGESTGVIVVIGDHQIFGASVGDSAAWLTHDGVLCDLTRNQVRKPLLGSGAAEPRHFGPMPFQGTLLVGTDGLFKYVKRGKITNAEELADIDSVVTYLIEQAQLPSGGFHDDATLVVCRPGTTSTPTQRPTLLLAENHAVFADIVVDQFLQDYEVTRASSIEGATEQLRRKRFGVLLVDFDLDDGKGTEILRNIGPELPRPRIVGISARDIGNERLLEAGADAICRKTDFHTIGEVLAGLCETTSHSRDTGVDVDRVAGALVGGFVGDALGRPFEGTPLGELARLHAQVSRRASRPGAWGYTDDTEMALGVAETLVDLGWIDGDVLAQNLARNCDVARGYGAGTRRVFESVLAGGDWRSARYASWPEGSKGNGGAVRAAPVACVFAEGTIALVEAADAAAAVTHAHVEARLGAQLVALVVAHALAAPSGEQIGADQLLVTLTKHADSVPEYERRLGAIAELLDRPGVPHEEAARIVGHRVLAAQSVCAAIYAFLRWHGSFEETVVNAVSLGGDTDSIGAMAGAMAGALHGVDKIPDAWLERLENGPRGRDYVLRLAEKLHQASEQRPKSG